MNAAKKDPRVNLEDILSAITKIGEYTQEGKDAFLADEKTQDAVIRQISIIGEAAAKLPASLRTKNKEIPWKKIIGMRNIIVHEYSETDLPTVWDTVQRDLPSLQKSIEGILD